MGLSLGESIRNRLMFQEPCVYIPVPELRNHVVIDRWASWFEHGIDSLLGDVRSMRYDFFHI